MKKKEYAVYKGDKFIDLGTVDELAKRLNKSKGYIEWLTSKKNRENEKGNAIVAYEIEDD